jgi:endonuclease YncB( thermonuclease family)
MKELKIFNKEKILLRLFVFFVPIFLYAQSGVLLRVIDGDTFLFKTEEGFSICQASFIDAPEARENDKANKDLSKCSFAKEFGIEAGIAAKDFASQLLKISKTYQFEITRTLSNANPVCDIKVPKSTLPELHPTFSEVMIAQGYALPYVIYADSDKAQALINLAKAAKKQKRGLWKSHTELMQCLVSQRYSLRQLR